MRKFTEDHAQGDVNIHYSIANRVETRAKRVEKIDLRFFSSWKLYGLSMDCSSLSAARLKGHFGFARLYPLKEMTEEIISK